MARNRARDLKTLAAYEAMGWRVLVVHECELKDKTALSARLSKTVLPERVRPQSPFSRHTCLSFSLAPKSAAVQHRSVFVFNGCAQWPAPPNSKVSQFARRTLPRRIAVACVSADASRTKGRFERSAGHQLPVVPQQIGGLTGTQVFKGVHGRPQIRTFTNRRTKSQAAHEPMRVGVRLSIGRGSALKSQYRLPIIARRSDGAKLATPKLRPASP